MNKRIYVEKKPLFQTSAKDLLSDLTKTLKIESLQYLRVIQIYDVIGVDAQTLEKALQSLFIDATTDISFDEFPLENLNYFCVEQLVGQFDQKAYSAIKGLILLGADLDVNVKTSMIYILNDEVTALEKEKITNYLINPFENQLKDLSLPIDQAMDDSVDPVITIDNFIDFSEADLLGFLKDNSLAMNKEDILHVQEYFKSIKRNPTITEILALDTYWSDHCRHTTFETHLTQIDFSKSNIKDEIEKAYQIYVNLKNKTNRQDRPMTLMEMASIEAKYQKENGMLDDLEISEEVNACSIEIDVDVDGEDERYLLMYKNETHNHPTEIEPYGGASTCVGGAIRDPLSGRAYVYQAMRITGAGNIIEPIENTLPNKLPQKTIAQKAASGNSSYGNQIGLAGTYLNELYHPGYVAKRMELGAVVGAVRKAQVIRETPKPGDYILMLGAPTGRDGVGGATGSSKVQDTKTLEKAMSEVQKGNAPEERKIQRLFRNPKLTKLIKKANDLGAGGVSVAIGELADGVCIDLNSLPTKYEGLNGTELALSESQERMVVVIDKNDFELFNQLAYEENVVVTKVASVSDRDKLEMYWNDQKIIDLDREFLDTNGVAQKIAPIITSSNKPSPFDGSKFVKNNSLSDSVNDLVSDLNYASLQSLASMFDNTIGRGTVLNTFGGKYLSSPSEVSAQKIPVENGFTNTVSMLAYGCNPLIGDYEPFYAGSYAIIESVARLLASGASFDKIRLSLQEYFEKVTDMPERFGKPVAALLGALHTQHELELPALGGKDSMSGTFDEIDVPPTIVSFAITITKTQDIISTDIKNVDENVYLILPKKQEAIDYQVMRDNFNLVSKLYKQHQVNASISIKDGGIIYSLLNMSFGNNIGVAIEKDLSIEDLFYPYYGGFIFTSFEDIKDENVILLGKTQADKITYQDEVINIKKVLTRSQKVLKDIYPTIVTHEENQVSPSFTFEDLKVENKAVENKTTYSFEAIEKPLVYIPVFMGTNSEYDIAKGFEKAGGEVKVIPFVDFDQDAIEKSINLMVETLDQANILALGGGFSAGDEPDGSGQFVLNVLLNDKVQAAINRFIEREGLIIGICNGFQALIKSGLLPYGKFYQGEDDMPTIHMNERGKHISAIVATKVVNNNSPWLSLVEKDNVYQTAISHGEGRFVASNKVLKELFENNQIIAQYVDENGQPTMDYRYNPSGSFAAIEGMVSKDGRIIGKMSHVERYEDGVYLNVVGTKEQKLFESAIAYFQKK